MGTSDGNEFFAFLATIGAGGVRGELLAVSDPVHDAIRSTRLLVLAAGDLPAPIEMAGDTALESSLARAGVAGRSTRDRGGRAVAPGRRHVPLRQSPALLDPRRTIVTVEIARAVGPARLDIAYERFGDPIAPPVVLIMGLGTQMLGWPDGFCTTLAHRGLHVIRFDNRDIGLSSHLPDAPMPDVRAALTGDPSSASYRLRTWPPTRSGCSTT